MVGAGREGRGPACYLVAGWEIRLLFFESRRQAGRLSRARRRSEAGTSGGLGRPQAPPRLSLVDRSRAGRFTSSFTGYQQLRSLRFRLGASVGLTRINNCNERRSRAELKPSPFRTIPQYGPPRYL